MSKFVLNYMVHDVIQLVLIRTFLYCNIYMYHHKLNICIRNEDRCTLAAVVNSGDVSLQDPLALNMSSQLDLQRAKREPRQSGRRCGLHHHRLAVRYCILRWDGRRRQAEAAVTALSLGTRSAIAALQAPAR